MPNNRDIKILHLEPTDVCQAACPLCLRETDLTFDKTIHHHLRLEQIISVFDQNQIANLNKMFMCGNYGDPAAGQHTLDIFQEFRKINPTITLGMNTNGALQNQDWWKTLASILNQPKDYVVFSIDGLEDTNHIYRQNVSWKRLIANVNAFITSGGSAHWDMLVYRHNEHQVELCEQYAKQLGFKWFRAKVSRRPSVTGIDLPVKWQPPKVESTVISCTAINENSLYIDAQGVQYPCCWIGASNKNQNIDFLEIQKSWNSKNPTATCQKTCGGKNQITNFSRQWQKEIELNV